MIPHKTIDEIKARIIIRMSQTSPRNEQNPRKLKAELRKNARSRHKEKRDFQGSIPRAKPSTSNDLRTATPPPPPLCKPRRRKGGRGEDERRFLGCSKSPSVSWRGRRVRFPGDAQGERPFNVPRLRSLLPRGNGIGNLLASHRDFASRLLSRHACDREETRVNQPTRCKGSG